MLMYKTIEKIQQHEKRPVTQVEIAHILGVSNVSLNRRINRKSSEWTASELIKLINHFGIYIIEDDLQNVNLNLSNNYDQVSIPYIQIPYIDEALIKSPRIKERLQFDKEVIENEWLCKPENLRIVKCGSHMMDGGDYPIRMNNVLIVDISSVNIQKRGVYLYTTHDKYAFIHGLWQQSENVVQNYYYNPSYDANERSVKELESINFKVYGRIVKNLSFTI